MRSAQPVATVMGMGKIKTQIGLREQQVFRAGSFQMPTGKSS
jgi:hypothetical protein